MTGFWERLDRAMRLLDPGPPKGPPKGPPEGGHYIDHSADQIMRRRPGGRRLAAERALARQYIEGFHAADLRLISARALAEGGSPGDDIRERRLARVVDGYGRVIDWLAEPLASRIRLSSIVTAVRWKPRRVVIEVAHRKPLTARAVIITIPLGVLQSPPDRRGAILFDPALRAKTHALAHLAMGAVVRCSGCEAALVRLVRGNDRAWLDMSGVSCLEVRL